MSRARSAGNVESSARERTESESAICGERRGEQGAYDHETIRKFAHTLRNPLNGARLHLLFLERELNGLGASADALDSARLIDAEISRIAELLKALVESPRAPEKTRTLISLRSLCARAIELLSDDAREVGVDVGADFEDPDLLLEVHRQEMEQVLFDLLHRALQGALAGGGRVLLRARRDADAGQAAIEIQHDGSCSSPGIDPGMDSQATDFSVAMRIVADHGGTIDVVTRPGQTSFHVKLPLSRGERAASGE
jgi:nitrogen-specific signal transduction histidine kinase